jgi:hypothetical protein
LSNSNAVERRLAAIDGFVVDQQTSHCSEGILECLEFSFAIAVAAFAASASAAYADSIDIRNKTIVVRREGYVMSHYVSPSGHIFSTENSRIWRNKRGPEYQLGQTITSSDTSDRCYTIQRTTKAELSANVLTLTILSITGTTPKKCPSPGVTKGDGYTIKIEINGDSCTQTQSEVAASSDCKFVSGNRIS